MTTLEQARPATETSNDAAMLERLALQYQVEQFLYAEAALLDARNYREWLGLLADEVVFEFIVFLPYGRCTLQSNPQLQHVAHTQQGYQTRAAGAPVSA